MDIGQRMAGAYRIFLALHVGDKEIVVGENTEDQGEQYMCGFCETTEAFALYSDVVVSDDYLQIIELYGSRITEQAEKARAVAEAALEPQIDEAPITAKDCNPITYADDIEGKIIVIKPDILRREYRFATHQIKLCEGGSGAHGNSRGNACFCVDLFSGRRSRFDRSDVLGTLDESKLPEWAKQGLEKIRTEAAVQKQPRVKEER
jgi:hypothetical protein